MIKKASISRLEKKADGLIQQASKLMWHSICSCCLVYRDGAGHHLIARRYKLYRHTLINVPYVCYDCHNKIHNIEGYNQEYLNILENKFYPVYRWYTEHKNNPASPIDYVHDIRQSIESLKTFIKNNGG